MLQSISWQDFLIAVFSFGLLYYIIVAVLFFRNDLMSMLRGHGRPFRQAELPGNEILNNDELMGKIEREMETAPNEQFAIPTSNPDDPTDLNVRADEVSGVLADLLEEIKSLQSTLQESQPSRQEIKSSFESLLQRHVQFVGTQYQFPISESIANSCTESLHMIFSVSEVMSWWPPTDHESPER